MSNCTTHWWSKQNWFEIKLQFFTKLQRNKFDVQYIIGDVVPHNLELLFQGQILKSAIFRKMKCHLANVTDMVQVSTDNQ